MTTLLGHDLSPMPIFTIFLGYWFPLDWILMGGGVLGNTTLLEKLQILSSSLLLNFTPTAIVTVLFIYMLCFFPFLAGVIYRRAICLGIGSVANILILIITTRALKLSIFAVEPAPVWIKGIVLATAIVIGSWLATRGLFLARYLVFPRLLALCFLPLATGLVVLEINNQFKLPHDFTVITFAPGKPRPPDIILVTLDSLSSRHLSCYEYPQPTSPHIDAFAQDAILFEQFYANDNWTRPGIASLLNGARPWTHDGDLGRPLRIVRDHQNLLGCLARAGYDIRTVSSNWLADHAWQGTPTKCAEQTLMGLGSLPLLLSPNGLPSGVIGRMVGPVPYINKMFLWTSPSRDRVSSPLAQAQGMLGRAPTDRPIFFWLHLLPPHDPYAAPEPYLGHFEPSPIARSALSSTADNSFTVRTNPGRQKILEGRYDEGILAADAAIGQLLTWLKAHGRFDRSLVAISSDHGESFSHGYGGHGGPLLTEDLVRVPCLIKPPGHKGAVRVKRLFEQADLAPTLLHLAGLPIPAGMEGQPYPLKPDGVPAFTMNRDLQTSKRTFSVAMRQENWKYVAHFGPWVHPWPQRELYDLDADPNENTNLLDRRPDITEPMHRRIVAELAKRGLKPEAP